MSEPAGNKRKAISYSISPSSTKRLKLDDDDKENVGKLDDTLSDSELDIHPKDIVEKHEKLRPKKRVTWKNGKEKKNLETVFMEKLKGTQKITGQKDTQKRRTEEVVQEEIRVKENAILKQHHKVVEIKGHVTRYEYTRMQRKTESNAHVRDQLQDLCIKALSNERAKPNENGR